jgi:hypothetical protein
MNQREKLQAQLEILQEMKKSFSKDVLIPSGEDFASMDTRYENGEIVVSMTFNQMEFENTLDSHVDMFFDDFVYETEKKLEDAMQDEDAYAETMQTLNSAIKDVDTLPYAEK